MTDYLEEKSYTGRILCDNSGGNRSDAVASQEMIKVDSHH